MVRSRPLHTGPLPMTHSMGGLEEGGVGEAEEAEEGRFSHSQEG